MRRMVMAVVFVSAAAAAAAIVATTVTAATVATAAGEDGGDALRSNWAVLVGTSRYWMNYRHTANTLAVYQVLKREGGFTDDRIVLMLADDIACNPRNPYPGVVVRSSSGTSSSSASSSSASSSSENLFAGEQGVEVDYRGDEVTVENFLRVLTGRHVPGTPESKKLRTDAHSNVLIYMTGHGGDEFLKFQDTEEIGSQDLAYAFEEMRLKQRFRRLFFLTDTCQAGSLANEIISENVFCMGSSRIGESSYAYQADSDRAVFLMDRFTFRLLEFFEGDGNNRGAHGKQQQRRRSAVTTRRFRDLMHALSFNFLHSHVDVRADLLPLEEARDFGNIPLREFFGTVTSSAATEGSSNMLPDFISERARSRTNLTLFDSPLTSGSRRTVSLLAPTSNTTSTAPPPLLLQT